MKVLIIGAHPDDEVLGVGGVISKHVENGDKVYICIVTKAYEPNWTKEYMNTKILEQAEVDKLFNIIKRFNLDLSTTKLNTIPHGEFNQMISEVVNEVQPEIIYTHYENDLNLDHTLVFRATLVATRPPKHIKILCYETLSESEWNTIEFSPNCYIEIKDYIDKKIEAFLKYKSEVKKYPHPRSPEGIRILAQKRGSEVCVEYAEAFKIIKDYWI